MDQSAPGYKIINSFFASKGWQPFPFQQEVWENYLAGKNGLLNAPTGSGKTFALFMPVLIDWINKHPGNYKTKAHSGLQLLWITPLRALTKDIQKALQNVTWELEVAWLIKSRTGDTSATEKQKISKLMPEVLITTPESLHLMLAQKEYAKTFKNLQAVVIDEWHELLGSKRGVQVELALSRLRAVNNNFRIWGISATIGNLPQALQVLLGEKAKDKNTAIVKAELEKELRIESILPDKVDRFPWSGQLGLRLLPKMIPIIEKSTSTLIFINTRAFTEIWYRQLLESCPELAGTVALHHGSLDREMRTWVEEAIGEGKLKVVICTSSLDLGVDFAPVETVIQVGSPKGVARFLQRAGRSGHRPGAPSVIYFLPNHSLELIEAAAIKEAIEKKILEDRIPIKKPFDVLLQYLVTLAVSDGFKEEEIFNELKTTNAYKELTREEWEWCLNFITTGGDTLREYDEYNKVVIVDDLYKVTSRRIAMIHRMSIGTIVSEPLMRVQFMKGSSLGTIEESFITRMKPGDIFWFSGRSLELVRVKEMTAYVKKSASDKGIIPRWLGGRLPLSAQLSQMFKDKLDAFTRGIMDDVELKTVQPMLKLQRTWSLLPDKNVFLIEKVKTNEGFHIFFFPFEGRAVHEGMAALTAFRLSQRQPITFSIAMNDYGFELLADEEVDIEHAVETGLFSTEYLLEDIQQSVNSTEMAKRRFREIAQISGLLFTGFPGKTKKNRHLQASSSLLFDVFKQYDPDNLLIKQSYNEVLIHQLDESRLEKTLEKINSQTVKVEYPPRPTPFAFPILVDRLREKVSSEKLEDRIKKMQLQFEVDAER